MKITRGAVLAVLSGLIALLAGCGGGSSGTASPATGTGSAAFSVVWPDRSRLVPLAADSIRITIRRPDGTALGSRLVARPSTSAVFAALPVGMLTAEATAHPNVDGSGTAQASGSVPLAIQAGLQTVTALTMGSTIARVEIEAPHSTLTRGRTMRLTAIAYDAPTGGSVVLTLPNTLRWSSSDRSVAVVDGTGVVTGGFHGQATIRADEIESGRSAGVTITTTGPAIYIDDQGNDRIVSLDTLEGSGGFRSFGAEGSGAGQFNIPRDIALDSRNRIYVADNANHRIVRMDDIEGTNLIALGTRGRDVGQFIHPTGVAVDSRDRIYVVEQGNHRVTRMEDMTGAGWTTFGSLGSGIGNFMQPVDIVFDRQERIYVTDANNNRIVRIDDMTGAGWVSFGGLGAGPGQFNRPAGIAVDDQGRIYVADQTNHRIVRMDDMSGTGWTTFGTMGDDAGEFQAPTGLFVR